MTLLDKIREEARQERTQDDWYLKQEPYVLELRTVDNPAKTGILGGRAYIVFPLGPEDYSVTRVMRQGVSPTLGGLVAEEGGMLWLKLTIMGSFGLAPKFSYDTTFAGTDPLTTASAGVELSGPGWTRRMLRNYFDKYAALKADPETAPYTLMIWHDIKTDDHWVVVPEEAAVERNVQRRFQYPWRISMTAIGEAASIEVPDPPSAGGILGGLGSARAAIAEVRQGTELINAAIIEGSEILGEVRLFANQIDSVIDDMTTITNSAASFVQGLTDTISVGRNFVTSTAAAMEGVLEVIEETAELPVEVRQNYQMALDGLHQVGAARAAYGATYANQTANLRTQERGAASAARSSLQSAQAAGPATSIAAMKARERRVNDINLVDSNVIGTSRAYGAYGGTRDHTITGFDTLTSIAARYLGDGALWYDIALLNGLKPPYITPDGGPGTVKIGDVIAVPVVAAAAPNALVTGGETPGLDRLGTDLRLVDIANDLPGRVTLDLVVDQSNFTDFLLISGIDNFAQALRLAVLTERGSMPMIPDYGLRQMIGLKSTGATATLLRLALNETISADPRTQRITRIAVTATDDVVEVSADVVPIGAENASVISTTLG